MENKTYEKRGLAALYGICPASHTILLIGTALIALHLLTRKNHGLMVMLSEQFVRPVHRSLAQLTSNVSFSIAEILIGVIAAAVLTIVSVGIAGIIRRGDKLRSTYKLIVRLLCVGASIYACFCFFWGVFFYGDDFAARSGLDFGEITVEELETVTDYFAALANDYSTQVSRDARGCYNEDRQTILKKSPEVFKNTEAIFPCLDGPDVRVKGVHFSRLMSYTDFTGFFFPFTAEANVNMDFPAALLASTVAHELAHQRGVAKEQEANFTAVLASLNYADADYCYSASLLAYIHLGNALYEADREAWREVYDSLNEYVIADLDENREYWRQFDTPVQTVSNTMYEGFLYSYDQDLGLKSYGACVDLLVNYYLDAAKDYLK